MYGLRRISGHTVCLSQLDAAPIAVDLGMHRGAFANELKALRPDARIFGIEPQPSLASELRRANSAVVVEGAIIGRGTGTQTLQITNAADSASLRENPRGEAEIPAVDVQCFTLQQLRSDWNIEHADIVKMDIEGTEIDLLTLGPQYFDWIKQMTVEFHCKRFPGDADRAERIITSFRRAGWFVQDFSRVLDDVLFLHPRHTGARWKLKLARLWLGGTRAARRSLGGD